MAKHNRLYKDSPKVERDEDGKPTVKRNTGPTKADGEDMGTEGNPIPGSDGKMPINNGEGDDEGKSAPEKEMYDRHHREIKEAHARHEDELKQIHKRHEKEVKKKNKETHAEKDDEETEAEEAAASKED